MPLTRTRHEKAQKERAKDAEQRDELAHSAANEREAYADGPGAGRDGVKLSAAAANAFEAAALDAPGLDEPRDDVARRDEDQRHPSDGHAGGTEPSDAHPAVSIGESVEQHRRWGRVWREQKVGDKRQRQGEREDDARLQHR